MPAQLSLQFSVHLRSSGPGRLSQHGPVRSPWTVRPGQPWALPSTACECACERERCSVSLCPCPPASSVPLTKGLHIRPLPPSRTVDKHPVCTSPGYFGLLVVVSSQCHVVYRIFDHRIHSLPSSPGLLPPLAPKKILFGFRRVEKHLRLPLHFTGAARGSVGLGYFKEPGLPTCRCVPREDSPPQLLHLRDGAGPHKPSSFQPMAEHLLPNQEASPLDNRKDK